MNERKQHVIDKAHQLFIDKGFQATSIQDILEYSGISKGTFYNYFSSKNELLIAIFRTIYKKLEKERNDLLIGQDPSNIEILVKQIELQLHTNRSYKLVSLFEEVIVSNDEDLKQFLKQGKLKMLYWLYTRFIDIFGESKKPYLLDCAIMFTGILQHNLKYTSLAYKRNADIHQVIRYSIARIEKIVDEVSDAGDQLIQPEALKAWLPNIAKDRGIQHELSQTIFTLKKAAFAQIENQQKHVELLDFILEELVNSKNPRKFLIESALISLNNQPAAFEKNALSKLEQLVSSYFTQLDNID
jgi:AcrR family transcriptional regulator